MPKNDYFMINFKAKELSNMKKIKYFAAILLLITLVSCGSFTVHQKRLITSAAANKPMRVFLITNKQDSILLRKKSTRIKTNSKIAKVLAQRLYATVRDSLSMGVGIAAPQVGILKNMICVQRFDKENFPFEIYLNPIITKYSLKKRPCPEGCLSIPNVSAITKNRAFTISIEYDTLKDEHKKEVVSDFTSVIFQHEIDHLNGILFIDHLKKDVSDAAKK